VFPENRNEQKRPEGAILGDDFKPFSCTSSPTANPACDYTEWPEVTALRPTLVAGSRPGKLVSRVDSARFDEGATSLR
jgi:hypothetical protein